MEFHLDHGLRHHSGEQVKRRWFDCLVASVVDYSGWLADFVD